MTVTANAAQAEVDAMLPTPKHAFSAPLPALGFGTHRIDVYAAESQGNVSVLIGSRNVTNQRPAGALESADATMVTGWAADPERLGQSVVVRVYINAVLAASATADVERPDLAFTSPISTYRGIPATGMRSTCRRWRRGAIKLMYTRWT